MPHIDVKCQPKNLSPKEFDDFIKELNQLVQKHFHASDAYIPIAYSEFSPQEWKSVYDKEIKPNLDKLAKKTRL